MGYVIYTLRLQALFGVYGIRIYPLGRSKVALDASLTEYVSFLECQKQVPL